MIKGKFKILIFWFLLFLFVGLYLSSGIYSLKTGQDALIIRCGKVKMEVTESGIHFHLPFPFESVKKVFVSEVKKIHIVDSIENLEQFDDPKENSIEMLTGDENLIMINAIINYDIKELDKYIYSLKEPEKVIESVGKECLRLQLGKMKVDDILSSGKANLRLLLRDNVQKILNKLDTGVRIISVELLDVSPPPSVSPSFKAVSDAREKKQEIIKSSEGYANSIIPKARGEASSILTKAEAYSAEVIAHAKGYTNAYLSVLKEYKKNPKMTRQLKYLETIKEIFSKVELRIDPDPSKSVYYFRK